MSKQNTLFSKDEMTESSNKLEKTGFSISIPTKLSIQLDIARGNTSKSQWIADAIEKRLIEEEINKSAQQEIIALWKEVNQLKESMRF